MIKYMTLLLFVLSLIGCVEINADATVVEYQGVIYENDTVVFSTDCAIHVRFTTEDNNAFIKTCHSNICLSWDEVYQFELANHHYAFKKERCN